ncbi:hypothetical protein ElyMa_001472200 [Elysia marginata]|uniref:Vitellogenin domain-containing protein n=1 Tax=Elysia marginata TaxID=1093978 RepID=A0AAV4J4L3_9GAST|nr:hypothetical protein ElyMa_001472200 [Elysia marginata]
MYHFSPKTPLAEEHGQYNYEFNMSESDFKKLTTVNSNPCYSSDEGSRIISLENGVVVAVKVTKFPKSDGEDEIECHVSNQNHRHTKVIVDSTNPYTTKAIALPDEIKQDYEQRKKWALVSDNVFCISYKDAVAVWVRPNVTLNKIKYVTNNGVAFSNKYGVEDVRTKVPTPQQCTLSGPADKFNWREKCGADKYCSLAADHDQLECKCKLIQRLETTSECKKIDSTTSTTTTPMTSPTTTDSTAAREYPFEIRLVDPGIIRCCSHFHPLSAMLVKCRIDPKNITHDIECKPFLCAEFAYLDDKKKTSVMSSPYVTSNEPMELESLLQLTKIIENTINEDANDVRVVLDTYSGNKIYQGDVPHTRIKKRSLIYNIKPIGKQYLKFSHRQKRQCLDMSTLNQLNDYIVQPRPQTAVSYITVTTTNSGNAFTSFELITLIVNGVLVALQ